MRRQGILQVPARGPEEELVNFYVRSQSRENLLCGAPRIHGELLMLRIEAQPGAWIDPGGRDRSAGIQGD